MARPGQRTGTCRNHHNQEDRQGDGQPNAHADSASHDVPPSKKRDSDLVAAGQAGISASGYTATTVARAAGEQGISHCDPEAGLRGGNAVVSQVVALVSAYTLVFWLLLSGQV